MKTTLLLFAILLCAAPVESLVAQGVIRQLPADGSWSRYRVSHQISDIQILRHPAALPKEMVPMLEEASPKAGFIESELLLSSVGEAFNDGVKCRWLEVYWKIGESEKLFRLLVPESSIASGGDIFEDAVKFMLQRTDSIEGLHGEVTEQRRREFEILQIRHLFPLLPREAAKKNVALMAPKTGEQDAEGVRGDVFEFHFRCEGKLYGGEAASLSHEGDYVVVATNRAPFGVEQIWEMNSLAVETGDCLTEARNDEQVTMIRGQSQIVLVESGTDAVSRFKPPAEKAD